MQMNKTTLKKLDQDRKKLNEKLKGPQKAPAIVQQQPTHK